MNKYLVRQNEGNTPIFIFAEDLKIANGCYCFRKYFNPNDLNKETFSWYSIKSFNVTLVETNVK